MPHDSASPPPSALATKKTRVVPVALVVDVGRVKLSPREAYMLSRVDGELALDDLADLTGLREPEVLESLEKLAELGLVRL